MPLLIVTGYPASGKSTIVGRIVSFLREEQSAPVVVVQDEDFTDFSRLDYNDANKEKSQRGFIRSSVTKALNKDTIVICDALNYIKGYRYELFLIAKLMKTTYGVLYVSANEDTCRWLNEEKAASERYEEKILGDIRMRYEEPREARWDKPLFRINVGRREDERGTDDENLMVDLDHPAPRVVSLPLKDIKQCLCDGVPLQENTSTVVAPLAPADFLHELDRTTQQVVVSIMDGQRMGSTSIRIPLADAPSDVIQCPRPRTLPELNRLRRQFIAISKNNALSDTRKIASLFVNFLNSNNL